MSSDPHETLRDEIAALIKSERPEVEPAKVATAVDEAIHLLITAGWVAEEIGKANDPEVALERTLRANIAYLDAVTALEAAIEPVAREIRYAKALADQFRTALQTAMKSAGINRVETADHVATPTKGRKKLDVYDETKLPGSFYDMVAQRNDERIRAKLTLGEEVPGARFVEGKGGIRVDPRKR